MFSLITLADFVDLPSDNLRWTISCLFLLTLWALFLPIFTFDHPPQWMVLLQPVLLIVGLLGVQIWIRTHKFGLIKRVFIFMAAYCTIMFATNLAGEGRGVFYLVRDAFRTALAILQEK